MYADAAFDTYNIGIDHNEGRTCPTPAEAYESFSHLLTIKRIFSITYGGLENSLYILNPNDQIVAQVHDPWECPPGSDPDDVCTCEQTAQFTPSATPPNNYNMADEYVWHVVANGGETAYMKYKFVWGDPF